MEENGGIEISCPHKQPRQLLQLTRLLPEQCLDNIVIIREQHCWTNNKTLSIYAVTHEQIHVIKTCQGKLACVYGA